MAAVAQRSLPLQTGTAQICARPDPFQQALIVCPPGFQGKDERTASGAPAPTLCPGTKPDSCLWAELEGPTLQSPAQEQWHSTPSWALLILTTCQQICPSPPVLLCALPLLCRWGLLPFLTGNNLCVCYLEKTAPLEVPVVAQC